jgi:hypothetical protein
MTPKQYFFICWALCIVSGFAVAPFIQTVALLTGGTPIESTPLFWAWIAIEGIVAYGLALFFGMKLTKKIAAQLLLLESNINWPRDVFKPAVFVGMFCALTLLFVDFILPTTTLNLWFLVTHIPLGQGLLGAFFGVINQEIILCFIWICGITVFLKKIFQRTALNVLMAVSIVIAALIFGVVHVPIFVHNFSAQTPLLIFKVMILNFISGITFGTLFWKKGFETAVLAHVVTDFILYVTVPALCLFLKLQA